MDVKTNITNAGVTDIETILDKIYPIESIRTNINVILAHGEFPHDKYLTSLLSTPTKTLICCDGAIENLMNYAKINQINSCEPDYIIGDCDSLNWSITQKYANKITTISDQNINDLTKAINLAHQLNLDDIIILGATGLREDHTIANIALLATYALKFNNIAIISDYGIFTAYNKPTAIPTLVGQQISFFTPNPATMFTCEELKWTLNKFQCNSWYNGTLNQAIDNKINLKINHGSVIVFRSFSSIRIT
jgi:thiamine pyrophosphokinase